MADDPMRPWKGKPIHLFSFFDPYNSSDEVLGAGQTFTGRWIDTTGLGTISVAVRTDQSGSFYVDFSPDGTNVDSTLTFTYTAGVVEPPHSLRCMRKFARVRFTNTAGSAQTYFRLQTGFGPHQLLTSPMNTGVSDDADATTVKAVLHGRNDNGAFQSVPIDEFGHMEVSVHSPRLPFGSLHAEPLDPVIQVDAVYGIPAQEVVTATNASGSVTAADAMFVCQTGTSIGGAGSVVSRRRIRYRPGQGTVCRFTAMFTTGVANSYQVAGMGHAEDGFYFGYVGTQYGILYSRGGVREVQTLTITTASTTAENVTVTLAGTAYSVAVTNSGSTLRTAYEISRGTFGFWRAEAVGSTVVFVNDSVGNQAGAFTLAATTAVGAFVETRAGAAAVETFFPQADWNGDKLDGTGPSGFTIDPTKINIYQIMMQYLGAGTITFQVEVSPVGNNPVFVTVHKFNFPGTLTAPHVLNPSFQFVMSAYSAGSTTNLTVSSPCFSAFTEGLPVITGQRFSYFAQSTAVGAVNLQALFSVRNTRYFRGKANQSVVRLLSVAGALKHTQPCTVYVIRDAVLAGNPNFTQYSTASVTYVDTAATTCTFSDNAQLVWSGSLGETGNFLFPFSDKVLLQPGEMITVAARSSAGSPAYVLASLNTREDQ